MVMRGNFPSKILHTDTNIQMLIPDTGDAPYRVVYHITAAIKDTAVMGCSIEEWKGGHEWYFFSEALKKTLEFWYKR